MANLCEFSMKITGSENEIKELIEMLSHSGKYKGAGLGRVYDFKTEEVRQTSVPGICEVEGWGDCAWSIKSSLRSDGVRERSLESESERFNLVIECYSSEPGWHFQEHLLIAKGDVIIDDCINYEEHQIDSYASLEEYNKANETDFTEDMINSDGYIAIGGYGDDYGAFEDALRYFSSDIVRSIPDEVRLNVYFDGVHMDTVYVSESELDKTINSLARYGYDDYNGAVKEEWEKLNGSNYKPKLSFKVVRAISKDEMESLADRGQSKAIINGKAAMADLDVQIALADRRKTDNDSEVSKNNIKIEER